MPQQKSYKQRRKQTIQFLTQDETKRLFKAIKKLRDRALFLTAYRHGLRVSEVSLLQRRGTVLRRPNGLNCAITLSPEHN